MATKEDVLVVARRNLGYKEGPNNDNKYSKAAGHPNHQPWCASFVVAVMRAAGVHLPSESAYTPAMADGFRAAKRWGTRPAVGAVVFFQWPGMGRIAHVGIVEAVRSDGSIVTIEGNTDVAGGRTGGQVMRKVRRANIAGYGYPVYAVAPKPAPAPVHTEPHYPEPHRVLQKGDHGEDVKWVQRCLTRNGSSVSVDGVFGDSTANAVVAFQGRHGLHPDGVVGNVTISVLRHYV